MHNAIPLIVTALIAVAIIVIGCFYLASLERILETFGLEPPASDADTRASRRSKMLHSADAAAAFGKPLHNVSAYAFRTQRI